MRSDPSNDDDLDRLLAQARWPEPSAEQLGRLTAHWDALQAPGRNRRWAVAALAAAASIGFIAALLLRYPFIGESHLAARPEQTAPTKPSPVEPGDSAAPAQKPLEVRPPNTYELVVLAGHARRREVKETRGHTRVSWRQRQVAEICQALTDDPQADVTGQMEAMRQESVRVQRLVWPIARNASDPRRLGATRLLAAIGTRESLPVLAELAADTNLHDAAIRGVARLATDRELVRLIENEADAGLRRELITLLVSRGTPAALESYLALLSDSSRREDTLAALAAAGPAGADALAAYLNDPRQSVRLAASYALSTLDDPRAAELLGQSLGGIGRQESLMGLLASRSPRADELVRLARRSPHLLGTLLAAEQQLRLLQTQSGEDVP